MKKHNQNCKASKKIRIDFGNKYIVTVFFFQKIFE